MFLPLGFGNLPKRFPFFALILVLGICGISAYKMSDIMGMSKKANQVALKKNIKIQKLKNTVMMETCLSLRPPDLDCKKFDEGEPKTQKKEKLSAKNTGSSQSLTSYLNFTALFKGPEEKWPARARATPSFSHYKKESTALKREILREFSGFASSEDASLSSFLFSSVTHLDWAHLMGNMVLLLFLGIWVEQRMGGMKFLATFFFGSFIGLYLQVQFFELIPVLGASAGVYAVMGAFFAFFYKAQISFLFLTVFYVKKIFLPASWTFPFIFFVKDFIQLASGESSGTAHLAHVGGLVLGLVFGFWQASRDDLAGSQLFPEEKPLEKTIKKSKNLREVWKAFDELMKWNCQNRPAIRTFLKRTQHVGAHFNHQQLAKIEKHLCFNLNFIMKNGPVADLVTWVRLIPDYVSLAKCLRDVPLSQILFIADFLAEREDWDLSLKLYEVSLTKIKSQALRKKVQVAINEIHNINQEMINDSSSKIAA